MHFKKVDTQRELPVMEHFYTIQGEGNNSGEAAYFIRLAGCDVGCVWCDVKESWDADKHPVLTIDKLIEATVNSGTQLCVITGGEPALYDLTHLVNRLKENNIRTAIETSGTTNLIGDIDWYCFSPKKFKKPVEEAFIKANEFKVIIAHPSDFQWAEDLAKNLNPDCLLFLQPEWEKRERFLPDIIQYVKEHPRWKISLQTHKYLNIP